MIKTLQDYSDKDYSLTKEDREKFIVIPREDFDKIMQYVRYHSYKLSSDLRQAQRKHDEASKQLEIMTRNLNDVDNLYEKYTYDIIKELENEDKEDSLSEQAYPMVTGGRQNEDFS